VNVLCPGLESERRVALLLSLTSIKSENKIGALVDHLCKGRPLDMSAMLNDVDEKNFKRTLKTLNAVALIVEQIKECDGVTKLTRNEGGHNGDSKN
jgi:hypothetical protein